MGVAVPAPLPTLLMDDVMSDLKVDRLSLHQTSIDTTIVADEVDKGAGLIALRNWVVGSRAETIAVGDSEADLSMFQVATRSFAPAQIGCATKARLLSCQIAPYKYQRGLLDIVRQILKSDRRAASRSSTVGQTSYSEGLFFEVLRAADMSSRELILQSLLHAS